MFYTGSSRPHLAPDEHGSEDDLDAVEEVVADHDRARPAGRPALARTDRFDRRRSCSERERLHEQLGVNMIVLGVDIT